MYCLKKFTLAIITLFIVSPAVAQVTAKEVFSFGDGVVWGFDFIDENHLVVSLRSGELDIINLDTKQQQSINSPRVHAKGQGGLLDVKVLHQQDKIFFYVTYSKLLEEGSSTTALASAEYLAGQKLQWNEIFVAKAASSTGRHYGSRLMFVDDTLFMTIGDRGKRDKAQALNSHHGKVLRLTLDGKAADNNPFDDTPEALPEIWSLGHRNPQGIAYDFERKDLYVAEFGPRGGDEVNRVEAGENYGWPLITHGKNYSGTSIGPSHQEGLEQPIVYWDPSISPSGMALLIDKSSKRLLLSSLTDLDIKELVLDKGQVIKQVSLFEKPLERVRHVAISPAGVVYFSTDTGKIFNF
jgi:glucose/arabinose dehydrogenase